MQYLNCEFVFSEAQFPHAFGRSEEDRAGCHGFVFCADPTVEPG
jgi:hypothetical protein